MDNILKVYAEKKVALDLLKRDLDELKADVVEVIKSSPDQRTESGDAMFSLRRSAKYKYSAKTELKLEVMSADKEILKIMKKEDEKDGATILISENFSPVMRISKD